ncbi:MAG TPA: RHS repeat-associated core domain-containing protein, partial [Gemmatimonadales bacterium]|nr:RHS repeat-associated core domain-containing protein [Gemmatimonadales bacterium]
MTPIGCGNTAGGAPPTPPAVQVQTHFDYNANNQLIWMVAPGDEQHPEGYKTTFDYWGGNLKSVTDALGHGPHYTYWERAISNADPSQPPYPNPNHEGSNRVKEAYDAEGHPATQYHYTDDGLLDKVTDPETHSTQYGYTFKPGLNGRTLRLLETIQDARTPAGITTYSYTDAQHPQTRTGQPLSIKDAKNHYTYLTYDDAGRMTDEKDPKNFITHRDYNFADALTKLILNYQPNVQPTVDTNVITEYGYDHLGRVLWQVDAGGEVTRAFWNNQSALDKTIVGCMPFDRTKLDNVQCGAFDPVSHPELNRPTVYSYDDYGRPTGVRVYQDDTQGILAHTDYDKLDRPWRQVQNFNPDVAAGPATNVTTHVEYLPNGQVHSAYDPLNRATVYGYDVAGRLTDVTTNSSDSTAPDTNVQTHTEYNAVNLPTDTWANYDPAHPAWEPATPGRSIRTHLDYDNLNRAIQRIENLAPGQMLPEANRVTRIAYDAAGNMVRQIDPLGRVTITGYDLLGRPDETVASCTDGSNHPQASAALPSQCAATHGAAQDENSRVSLQYNARGEVAQQTDPGNRVTTYRYDALSRVLHQVANANGAVAPANVPTDYTYDSRGHLLTTIALIGFTAQHQPITVQYVNQYNSAGWLDKQTDPTGRWVAFGHDGLGQLVDRIDHPDTNAQAPNRVLHTEYDRLGRATQVVVNYRPGVQSGVDTNLTTTRVYDRAGRVLRQVAPGPNGGRLVTGYGYDGLDRLQQVVENQAGGNGNKPQRVVSRINGVDTPTDDSNATTTYAYDRDRLTLAITDPKRLMPRIQSYTAAGWLAEDADPASRDGTRRHTTLYAYDAAGRQTSILHRAESFSDGRWQPDNGDPSITIANSYDGLDRLHRTTGTNLTPIVRDYDITGHRLAMTDESGRTTYGYNGLDYLTSVRVNTGRANGYTVNYGYDFLGRRTNLTTDNGAPALTYTNDLAGRLQVIGRGNDASYASADYDPVGRLHTIHRGRNLLTTYTYDAADRVTDIETDQLAANGNRPVPDDTPLAMFHYSLYPNGQAAQATETLNGVTRRVDYQYDGLGRLFTAIEHPGDDPNNIGWAYRYIYDAAGNRTGYARSFNQRILETTTSLYNPANQQTDWRYDDAGNVTANGSAFYTYDGLNRLVRVGDGSSGPPADSYQYNGDGQLLTDFQRQATVHYTIDFASPLPTQIGAALDTSGGRGSEWYTQGWGQQLAREPNANSRNTTWFATDRLGSVRLKITAQGQTALNYDPYGSVETAAPAAAAQLQEPAAGTTTGSGPGFTGEPQAANGLVYLRSRWYNPNESRFLSRDSYAGQLADPTSLHPYLYGASDPVNHTDPSGHCVDGLSTWFCVAAIAILGAGAINLVQQRDAGAPPINLAHLCERGYLNLCSAGAASAEAASFFIPGGLGGNLLARVGLTGGRALWAARGLRIAGGIG